MILFSVILSHAHLMGSSIDEIGPGKEANSYAGQGCYFTSNKVKVLSMGRICFHHVRLDVDTLGKYFLSRGMFVLRLFRKDTTTVLTEEQHELEWKHTYFPQLHTPTHT